MAMGVGWERERRVTGIGIMGHWVISSCDLLVPSGSACSVVSHFHLMVECYCTHLNVWFVKSDDIQLMLGCSGHVVIWRPMAKHTVSLEAQ